jgi:hypothetical protein
MDKLHFSRSDSSGAKPLTLEEAELEKYRGFLKRAVHNGEERVRYGELMLKQAEKYRDQMSTQLRLFARHTNLGELEAKIQARDMILLLAGLAKDHTLDVKFRRECAKDIIERAIPLAPQRTEVITPDKMEATDGRAGTIIDADIEQARLAMEQMAEMTRCIGTLPPDQWPQWLQEKVGKEAMKAYQAEAPADPSNPPPTPPVDR